jgi:hypothetical protein
MTPGGTSRLFCPGGQLIHESHEEVQPHVAAALSSSNWTEGERFTRAERQAETEDSTPRDLDFQTNDNQGLSDDGCIVFACDTPCRSHRSVSPAPHSCVALTGALLACE